MKRIVGHTKEDVSTLPRWARERIERLTKDVEHWQSVAHSTTSPGKTNVTLVDGVDERGLPPNSRVRFYIDRDRDARRLGGYIEVGLRPDAPGRPAGASVEVRCGDGVLSILPAVSNVVYVRIESR